MGNGAFRMLFFRTFAFGKLIFISCDQRVGDTFAKSYRRDLFRFFPVLGVTFHFGSRKVEKGAIFLQMRFTSPSNIFMM